MFIGRIGVGGGSVPAFQQASDVKVAGLNPAAVH